MTFTNLWPIALLIFIPGILLLYMLKQKAQDYEFSSNMLWKERYHNIEATTPWERLRKNLLMLLQIITVLLLIIALMAPYLKSGGKLYQNVVIVLDNSASMGTQYNEKRTRYEEALDRACEYVDSLGEGTQVTVITSAMDADIVINNVSDRSELKQRIQAIPLTDLAGDAAPSVSLVKSMSVQWEHYEAVILTDTALELGDVPAKVINLYSDADNLSVDYVSYGKGENDNTITAIAKIHNYTKETVTTDVSLYGDDVLLGISNVTIAPQDTSIAYFENVPFSGRILKAEMNHSDALVGDNIAYAVMNADTFRRVLIIGENNMFLEKAVNNVSWVDLYKTSDASVVDAAQPYDLYIYDGITPQTIPTQGNLLFFHVDTTDYVKKQNTYNNIMLTFQPSQVSNYIENYSFGVNEVDCMELPIGATNLLPVSGGSAGYYEEQDGRRIAAFGFDLHQTDLALQAEFPILISNLMDYMLVNGLVGQTSYTTGSAVTFHANINGSELTVTNPNGENTTIEAAMQSNAYLATEKAGVYKVEQTVEKEIKEDYFVMQFPVNQESNVTTEVNSDTHTVGTDQSVSGGRDLRNVIILLSLLALIVEWVIYIRRQ